MEQGEWTRSVLCRNTRFCVSQPFYFVSFLQDICTEGGPTLLVCSERIRSSMTVDATGSRPAVGSSYMMTFSVTRIRYHTKMACADADPSFVMDVLTPTASSRLPWWNSTAQNDGYSHR